MWAPGQQSQRFPKAPVGQLFPFDDNSAIPDRDTLAPTDWNNMTPRLGFAWDPTGSRKFSVRGAYGIFFSGQNIGIRIVRGSTNQPFTKVISTFGQTIRNPFTGPPFNGNSPFLFEEPVTEAQAQAADFSPNSEIIAIDPDFATPYIQQYNLSVQYQLGRDWMAEVAYVGSKSTKIFNSHDINAPVYIPGVDESGNPLSPTGNNQQRRPFSFISKLEVESTSSNANYNSLQLKLNKRFSKGLTVNTSYVWSKSLGWNVPLGRRRRHARSKQSSSGLRSVGLGRPPSLCQLVLVGSSLAGERHGAGRGHPWRVGRAGDYQPPVRISLQRPVRLRQFEAGALRLHSGSDWQCGTFRRPISGGKAQRVV